MVGVPRVSLVVRQPHLDNIFVFHFVNTLLFISEFEHVPLLLFNLILYVFEEKFEFVELDPSMSQLCLSSLLLLDHL